MLQADSPKENCSVIKIGGYVAGFENAKRGIRTAPKKVHELLDSTVYTSFDLPREKHPALPQNVSIELC